MQKHPASIEEIRKIIVEYVRERDWEQFHNPKDVALSLVLESSEVLEHFQWKSPEEMASYVKSNRDDIGEELADVLYWVILLSHYLDLDLPAAFIKKMEQNRKKYPVEKAKGSHAKYTKHQ